MWFCRGHMARPWTHVRERMERRIFCTERHHTSCCLRARNGRKIQRRKAHARVINQGLSEYARTKSRRRENPDNCGTARSFVWQTSFVTLRISQSLIARARARRANPLPVASQRFGWHNALLHKMQVPRVRWRMLVERFCSGMPCPLETGYYRHHSHSCKRRAISRVERVFRAARAYDLVVNTFALTISPLRYLNSCLR